MSKKTRVTVILTYHEDTGALDVFMGDEKPEFGAAKRVVEKDGISLALRENNEPVFIRIADAQRRNKTFARIASCAEKRKPIGGMVWDHVLTYCLKLTDKILELDNHRRKPELGKYVFNSLPASV